MKLIIIAIIALVIGLAIGRISIHSETPEYIYARPQLTGCSLPECEDCKLNLKGFYDPVFILQTFKDKELLKKTLRGGFKGWDRFPDEKKIDNIIDVEYPKIINKVKDMIKEYEGKGTITDLITDFKKIR